jgi:hypothetical protein
MSPFCVQKVNVKITDKVNGPRGPSAGWWVLTTANAAGTNILTCLPKDGGARDRKIFGHSSDDWPLLTLLRNSSFLSAIYLKSTLLTSGRWPVVKTIAESLSQHDEKHVAIALHALHWDLVGVSKLMYTHTCVFMYQSKYREFVNVFQICFVKECRLQNMFNSL